MPGSTLTNLHQAVLWAAELHAGQDREGDPAIPYLTHPLEVLNHLRLAGVKDDAVLAAAVLHDVVEESQVSFDNIEAKFGPDVAGLVREMTRNEPTEAEVTNFSPDEKYAIRSQMLLDEIARMSPRAQAIKLADRLSNLREALLVRTGKKLNRYLAQSRRILEIIPETSCEPLWNALYDLVTEQNPVR